LLGKIAPEIPAAQAPIGNRLLKREKNLPALVGAILALRKNLRINVLV
jgi:hypothetical protein